MDTPATNPDATAADFADLPSMTSDLPDGFRLEPVSAEIRAAIRASGLQLVGCIHGTACDACVAAAARAVAALA